jgi:hypothetical protein
MRDISKAIVDGSLEHIAKMDTTKAMMENRRDPQDSGNRFQRRAKAALQKKIAKVDNKLAALTRAQTPK